MAIPRHAARKLSVEEKQDILMQTLLENEKAKPGYAIFGVEKEVVIPLVKKGYIYDKTYKYTGGATLTNKGREITAKAIIPVNVDINKLSKPQLKILIDQLETAMSDILKAKDMARAEKLNILIGDIITLYNSK